MKWYRLTQLFLCLTLLASPLARADDFTLRMEITGVSEPVLKNIQEHLQITTQDYHHLSAEDIQTLYKNAAQTIKNAIEPFGYFKATITPELTQQGNVFTAHFKINPGAPLHVTHFEFEMTGPGRDNPELQKAIHALPLREGQIFRSDNYNKTKQLLFQTANDQGYLKAVFTKKEVYIDLQKYTATIVLHLDTGKRYYFGPVTFQQNTFSAAFMQRFVSFQAGEPFSNQKLIKFQQNLSNSTFFQSVNVIPNLQEPLPEAVPVKVDVLANKSQQYNFGLGYGTFTGPRLTLGTNFRHLTDTGHHLDLQLKLSEVLRGLAAQYVIPGQNPLTDQYTIGANIQRFIPKNGDSISKTVSFGYVKTIDEWKWNAAISYMREHYNIVDNPSYNSRLLYPSINITRVKADDLVNTHAGSKIDLLVRGANTHVVSNVSFAQAEIKGKYIFSPTDSSRVILRGDLGYTTVQDLNKLPISLQFYAGGLDSVRGFPYSYFGPGRYLKTGSVEFQHHLVEKFSGAVFYDVGTADNHINAAMGSGKGVGLIYESFIGPIKAYVGLGTLQNKPHHLTFELSLGPDL